jgi:hypothetical protein
VTEAHAWELRFRETGGPAIEARPRVRPQRTPAGCGRSYCSDGGSDTCVVDASAADPMLGGPADNGGTTPTMLPVRVVPSAWTN